MEQAEKTYEITLANSFDATSIEAGVAQFVEWVKENAHAAGYRVTYDGPCILTDANIDHADDCTTHDHEVVSVFIDADDIDFNAIDIDADDEPVEHVHSFYSGSGSYGGGAWRCDCGATKPRLIGPGV